jgi:5'-AMP-activated protein kinase, catalytic alpha subunit
MTEVHKAMFALGCVWYPVTNYRVLCLWKYISPSSTQGGGSVLGSASLGACETASQVSTNRSIRSSSRFSDGLSATSETNSRYVDASIKIALSLYKVQQNIYLLDFQRIEVRSRPSLILRLLPSHHSFSLPLSNRAMPSGS